MAAAERVRSLSSNVKQPGTIGIRLESAKPPPAFGQLTGEEPGNGRRQSHRRRKNGYDCYKVTGKRVNGLKTAAFCSC
jgi:hypothetical protein